MCVPPCLQYLRAALKSVCCSYSCQAWSFSIDPNPVTVNARVLDPPTLNAKEYALIDLEIPFTISLFYLRSANGRATKIRPGFGTFDMRGKQFLQPAKAVTSWGVIVFEDASRFGNEQVKSALEMLSKVCRRRT